MIASVEFRNFKALRNASLTLSPFNLLIGPSGSGKTSLIQALLRLRTLAKLPVADKSSPGAKPRGPEISFQFNRPHDAINVRLSCVSDLVCDLLRVTPANAPGWPVLKADIARIRGCLLDHYAMAEPAPRSGGAELASNGGNLAAVLAERRERDLARFVAEATARAGRDARRAAAPLLSPTSTGLVPPG